MTKTKKRKKTAETHALCSVCRKWKPRRSLYKQRAGGKICGQCGGQHEWLPTPAEIQRATAKFRESWTESEYQARAGDKLMVVTLPSVTREAVIGAMRT